MLICMDQEYTIEGTLPIEEFLIQSQRDISQDKQVKEKREEEQQKLRNSAKDPKTLCAPNFK